MIEFHKQILTKVSFDKVLFRKELVKALKWLKKEDGVLLKAWCLVTFVQYKDIIYEAFRTFSKN